MGITRVSEAASTVLIRARDRVLREAPGMGPSLEQIDYACLYAATVAEASLAITRYVTPESEFPRRRTALAHHLAHEVLAHLRRHVDADIPGCSSTTDKVFLSTWLAGHDPYEVGQALTETADAAALLRETATAVA